MDSGIRSLAGSFMSGNTTDTVDIVTFAEAKWGLGLNLLPVQRFLLRAYYGLPLDTKPEAIEVRNDTNDKVLYRLSEVEFLAWLYSQRRCNTDKTEGKVFNTLILAMGRRASKSTLCGIVSNYEIYKLVKRGNPSAYYGFPPDTVFSILNVAPTDEQAGIVFNYTTSMAMGCRFLHNRCLHQTMTYFDIMTDKDMAAGNRRKRANIISISGGSSSTALRGRNGIVVIMDEFAFFYDNNGRFSGHEVYKALTPSIASFQQDGKILVVSSTYGKYGAFYERHEQSFNETDTTLMLRMYSAMVNPTIHPSILKAEKRRDKVSFNTEYGGEFSDTIRAWVEEEDVRSCITAGREQQTQGLAHIPYFVGIDLGLKDDGTALAVVHREGPKIVLDYATAWYSGSSSVWQQDKTIYTECDRYRSRELLSMSEIAAEVAELCRWFPVAGGIFDQHNGYGLMELLHQRGLKQFQMKDFGDTTNSDMFMLLKSLFLDHLIELYDHPILIPELISLEAELSKAHQGQTSAPEESEIRGRVKVMVHKPAKAGCKDDLSDALARAAWLCRELSVEGAEPLVRSSAPPIGTIIGSGSQALLRQQLDRRQHHGLSPRPSGADLMRFMRRGKVIQCPR